ncbi:hypothetical protein M23134_08055 [Microscilla marina ATCC 23134]|uniref:TauD/TfdA-like domain-containing protein n=2 Tax=Microscilla marina TaxID=1027 RepID=A1ZGW4_MICM2|nr:hypothetical protein M23134_08055 [Microscilla marina ATCC 23134]
MTRWGNEDTVERPFPASDQKVKISLIDAQSEPLRFAKDINLADHSFVANLNAPYSEGLKYHLANETDVITAFGVTSYLGVEGTERIIQEALINGNTQLFCFSVVKYLNPTDFVELCRKCNLEVQQINELPQRAYKNQTEQERVTRTLKEKGMYTRDDEENLMTLMFLAYKKDLLSTKKAGISSTLIVANKENELLGHSCNKNPLRYSSTQWAHPWHIVLSQQHSENRAIYQKLTELHTQGAIAIGDTITAISSATPTSTDDVVHLAKLFAGEYQVTKQNLPEGQIKQTLTRIEPIINAHIVKQVPASSEALEVGLKQHGHLLVRTGQAIDDAKVLKLLTGKGKAMDYRYGNVARQKIKGTSALQVTPWSKELCILPHSELTYHTKFPKYISFVCKVPAEHGGETAIYDCAKAFDVLSPDFQAKATQHNVIFRKRYVQSSGHDRYPSWQQVMGEGSTANDFMTHFNALGYNCVQLQEEDNKVIETQLTRPLVYQYQGKKCLHSSIVGISPYWYQQVWPGKTPPLTVTWDNNEPFSIAELRHMEEALLLARISYNNWQKHDVLFLDNLRVAHGRLPFTGKRVTGALMAQPAQFVKTDEHWNVELVK